ncbi:hypothetical protein F4680DRAFT_177980 [Xylaria scruposa]|nr:hypothetical protein F4680DRAFT_177980 [Xylaria scruposa]
MSNYMEYGSPYDYDEFWVSEHQSLSEWSASPSASTPMTREPSGESAISTYSNDPIRTPSSEYGAYGSSWPSVPVGNHDAFSSSPISNFRHRIPSAPAAYNPPYTGDYRDSNESGYNTGAQDSWWNDYDFIADLEPGQEPYWRLKPHLEPTDWRPAMRAHEDKSATESHPQRSEGLFVCMESGCPKSFRRKADLERHLAQMHTPREKKLKYPCDWKKCQRAKEPFGRRDHQRDHYRQFHHEDIMTRGSSGRGNQRWWDSRAINPDWWRCARCLSRVKVREYAYTCPKCRINCEPERQDRRIPT